MRCNTIVIVSVVFALVFGWPGYSAAETKPVSGKKAASAVRANNVGKSGKMSAQSNRRAPNRKSDKGIVKRMKEIRLPAISFKPPATIVDAVEFFRVASRDYDSADIPIEERGLNFVLRVSADVTSADFAGVPVVPPVFASDIAFDEALDLVCESVGYRFTVQGGVIVVSSTASGEMEQRNYSIKSAFAKILDSLCALEKDGDPLESVFSNLGGVDWPDGSSIVRIKSAGKLRVCNTYENIARLERVLSAFNATGAPLTASNTRSADKAAEQAILKRMKEIRLPAISFKPPATIVDAVEFFRTASIDFGSPDIPIEKRGINFALKSQAGNAEWPAIPTISAKDIQFDEALKLVCESVCCKFTVRGNVVFVGSGDSDEIEFRTYSIRSSAVKSMMPVDPRRGSAKRGADNDASFDWKDFLLRMGVKWPEGSRVVYIESAGKLFVGNTCGNLSTLEQVLKEMKLIQGR